MPEPQSPETDCPTVGLPLAIVAHVVALAICVLAVSSVFTSDARALDSGDPLHPGGAQGAPLLLALLLAAPVLWTRGRFAGSATGKVIAAAGLVYVFSLSADRVIADEFIPAFARSLHLSWGGVVVITGGLAWGVCVLAGLRLPFRPTGFEAPTLITVAGLAVVTVGISLASAWEYGPDGIWAAMVAHIVRLAVYGLVFTSGLCLAGVRKIGPALHLYAAAALIVGLAATYALHLGGDAQSVAAVIPQ